ncbi:uncharacterized protein LOC119685663 [Teleopsis dalmanni]|uniref:uncharacterized protein LOC119685663 n=1 Tax=Teleopsis dalmanni TaxID=139649 RepID=UPI0018CF9E05|nr:uncharacterized protein LOC119685663 [Teleopsis dalmanni]
MSKMSLEDSDTEGACASNFKKSSSDNIFHTQSTYLKLPSRVDFKSESSSSESDLDVRKACRRLPVLTTPSNKTLESESSHSKSADKCEAAICQLPCVQYKYNRGVLQDTDKTQSTSQEKLLTAISESYNTENSDKVNPFNSNPKKLMEHSQLELKRLQIKKELKQIELLDVMLTREKERSIRDNYRFEKEMLLLKTEITKTLNKSVITNSTNTSQ